MVVEPIYITQSVLATQTWAVDIADILVAYASDLGESAPTLSDHEWSEESGGLTIASSTTYDGNPGATFSGGTAGTTYTVNLVLTLSNGDEPVVTLHIKVT